tara:strand:- start:11 stop:343 length:333 start_codon:yes stop_codon:yes gene_type:complete
MPTFPKKKSRPWTTNKTSLDHKGLKPLAWANDENKLFYNSKSWRSLRAYWRQMNPLCKICEDAGYITGGECVDHIIPIRFKGEKTSLTNLQTLCNSCHARKTGEESHITK